MRMQKYLLALTLFTCLPVGAATAYTITLSPSGTTKLTTQARTNLGGNAFETVTPTALPYSNTSTVADGSASAMSVSSLSFAGFFVSFDHARSSSFFSQAQSFGTVFFSSDQDVNFVAAGSYSAADSEGRRVQLLASLTNQTTSSQVFQFDQVSNATANESFTLGGSGGDAVNTVVGALSGVLLAGNIYRWDYASLLQAFPSASSSGATASGDVSLSFSPFNPDPPPVPEPGTALLTSLGLALLTAARRGSRRDQA